MPRIHNRKPGSRSYKSYSQKRLDKAAADIKTKKITLRKVSAVYKIPVGTMSHRLNNKYSRQPGHASVFSEKEAAFVVHITAVAEWGFPFDSMDLRVLAHNYVTAICRTIRQFKTIFLQLNRLIQF
uniref:HTH psq-type domain-containing protein n=1 Tax=Octopus bimaculoides TaxID=37653 RepID=A0A0L8HN16_OCTBM